MLVLTRTEGEFIRINDDIRICIVSIKGGKVRVGIDAPLSVKAHREEIYRDIQKDKEKTKTAQDLA